MAAWQALRILQKLGLRPKRTLRVVLWTNEENGVAGGKGYRAALGDAAGVLKTHVAAIEMDGGMERPDSFGFTIKGRDPAKDEVYQNAAAKLRDIATLFAAIDADQIDEDGGGVDIGPLMAEGVPGLSLETVGEHYFDWHHTDADTLDKVDPQDFRRAVGMLAVMGYVLADMPGTLVPAGTPSAGTCRALVGQPAERAGRRDSFAGRNRQLHSDRPADPSAGCAYEKTAQPPTTTVFFISLIVAVIAVAGEARTIVTGIPIEPVWLMGIAYAIAGRRLPDAAALELRPSRPPLVAARSRRRRPGRP